MLVLTLGGLVENCNLYHEFPLLIQLLSDQIKNKTKQKKKKEKKRTNQPPKWKKKKSTKKTNISFAHFKNLNLGIFHCPA